MDEDDNDDMMRHYAEWEAWAEQIDENWEASLDEQYKEDIQEPI